jgi:hypothetical protein
MDWYPFLIALGLALLVASGLFPSRTPSLVLRVASLVSLVLAAVLAAGVLAPA